MAMVRGVLLLVITIVLSVISDVSCYLPIIMMHGLDGQPSEFSYALNYLKTEHPGQFAVSLDVDNHGDSHQYMGTQVKDVTTAANAVIANNSALFEKGFHLVGHSQGGLLTRAVIMAGGLRAPVVNYVSLAGPQFGVYGNYSQDGTKGLTPAEITEVLYTAQSQATRSFANYWRDALSFENYVTNALWLATLNNETVNPLSVEYKKNFLSVSLAVFCASPADEAIIPWESSQFGFWNKDVKTVSPMQSQQVYIYDSFGLKTLESQGKLIIHTVPGVAHSDWMNVKTIWETYVLPYLT